MKQHEFNHCSIQWKFVDNKPVRHFNIFQIYYSWYIIHMVVATAAKWTEWTYKCTQYEYHSCIIKKARTDTFEGRRMSLLAISEFLRVFWLNKIPNKCGFYFDPANSWSRISWGAIHAFILLSSLEFSLLCCIARLTCSISRQSLCIQANTMTKSCDQQCSGITMCEKVISWDW